MEPALCPHFGTCGGCQFQNIPYEKQLKTKEALVKSLFGECAPILPSPEIFFYRNRMDYAFGPNYSLGLKKGKFEIINIEKCFLLSEESNKILNRLRQFVQWKKLDGYIYAPPIKTRGPMRHVIIREGKNVKNTILNILTSDKVVFPIEELWEKLQDAVTGLTWSINLSPADRSYGEIQATRGQAYLVETFGKLKFHIPVQAFFQTNTHGAEKLIEIIKEFAALEGGETLLDLYSGTGSIGLSLADKAKQVIGVEENEPAAKLSEDNAKLNNISNYSAIVGRAEKAIHALEGKFEIVVVDPPRPGVHKKVLEKIGEIKPKKIVYVSCNPTTQQHDVKILEEFRYKVEKCQPLDMFPHTPHVENVVSLILK
jgi:23S rRNA (uracil-5-)-methyltransferase RumA